MLLNVGCETAVVIGDIKAVLARLSPTFGGGGNGGFTIGPVVVGDMDEY